MNKESMQEKLIPTEETLIETEYSDTDYDTTTETSEDDDSVSPENNSNTKKKTAAMLSSVEKS